MGYGTHAQQKLLGQLLVKEVMTPSPITIAADAPIAEAARLMIHHKVGCLVVTESEKVVGVLTESDFVSALADAADG